MENSQIIWTTVIIAAIALIGRIVINRQQKGAINWYKIMLVGVAIVLFFVGFIFFKPQQCIDMIQDTFTGKVSLIDGQHMNIAGRRASEEFPRYESNTYEGGMYCVPVADSVKHTGYYILKNKQDMNDIEREEKHSEDNRVQITRTSTTFEMSRNPGDKREKYLNIYKFTLKSGDKVLVALEADNVDASDEMPICRITPCSDRLTRTASTLDSTLVTDIYLLGFNSEQWASNQFNYIIYRVIAGIIFAILGVLVLVGVKGVTVKQGRA